MVSHREPRLLRACQLALFAALLAPLAPALLEARRSGSWRSALSKVEPRALGTAFSAALGRGAGDAELSALAVDDVLATRARADPAAVRALRAAGAGTPETVVATVLSARLRVPSGELWTRVSRGDATWGGVLSQAGIAPRDMDAVVRELVR